MTSEESRMYLSRVAELVWLAVGSGDETPLLPGAGPDLNQS